MNESDKYRLELEKLTATFAQEYNLSTKDIVAVLEWYKFRLMMMQMDRDDYFGQGIQA